jgi:small subunit ribosomal protein S20
VPIIKSAKKRVKVTAKAGARNARTKRDLRNALKAFAKAVDGKKADQIAKTALVAVKAIDIAAKKAVIHKNKAARYKSRIAREAKAAGVKPGSEPSRPPAKADAGKATRRSTAGKPAKSAGKTHK